MIAALHYQAHHRATSSRHRAHEEKVAYPGPATREHEVGDWTPRLPSSTEQKAADPNADADALEPQLEVDFAGAVPWVAWDGSSRTWIRGP